LARTLGLLAPTRRGRPHGDRVHAGTITPTRLDELWGTDATRFYTRREGWCWFFGAIDHCAEDLVGWHGAKLGDRWAALEPIRPSFVGEPECNGIMERWIRTLKEECLYLHDFARLDEAREVIGRFIECYNHEWLLERHGYRTPAEVRRALTQKAAA
jgi:putative transposase